MKETPLTLPPHGASRAILAGSAYAIVALLVVRAALRWGYDSFIYSLAVDPALVTVGLPALVGLGAAAMTLAIAQARTLPDTKLTWDEWGVAEHVCGAVLVAIPWSTATARETLLLQQRKMVGRRRYRSVAAGRALQIEGRRGTITIASGQAPLPWMVGRHCWVSADAYEAVRARLPSVEPATITPDERAARRPSLPWLRWLPPLLVLAVAWSPSFPALQMMVPIAPRALAWVAGALMYARAWPALREILSLRDEGAALEGARRVELLAATTGGVSAREPDGTQVRLDVDQARCPDERISTRTGPYLVIGEASGSGGPFRGSAEAKVTTIESAAAGEARARLLRAALLELASRTAFATLVLLLLLSLTEGV